MRTSHSLVPSLLLAVVAGGAFGQDPVPEGGEGLEILTRLDARIYSATEAGLHALAFTYRPQFEGQAGGAPFMVRYFWRKDVGDTITFLDAEGVPLVARDDQGKDLRGPDGTPLPGVPRLAELDRLAAEGRLAQSPEEFLRTRFLTASRGLGRSARGISLVEKYRNFRMRVHRKVVNHSEDVSLVLEPRNPKTLRRLTISLDRNGLPWKWERSFLDGRSSLQYHTYKARGEVWVLMQMQETLTPKGQTEGIAYAYDTTYQRVGGILIPATIKKLSKALPSWASGTTEFHNVKVNGDVPSFVPMPDTPVAPIVDNPPSPEKQR